MFMLKNNKGLTLVELMIALALTIIITGVMYSLYRVQSQSTTVQSQVAEMQQNLRAGADILTREIRMAGYDPNGTGNYGVTTAEKDKFSYNADICENGGTPANGTDCTELYEVELYDTSNGVSKLRRTPGGLAVAENVEQLEFCYWTDNTGCNTATITGAGNLAGIKAVTISILVRSSKEASDYQNTITYTSRGGQDWTPAAADGFRRRLLVKTIQLRNMGL